VVVLALAEAKGEVVERLPLGDEPASPLRVLVPGRHLGAPLLQRGRLLASLPGFGEERAPSFHLRARELRGLGGGRGGGRLLLVRGRRPFRGRVFEEVVARVERDLAARGAVEVGEGLAGRVGADAVEDVVLAEGGDLDHLAAVDHRSEVGLVVRDRVVLLHPARDLQGEEPLLVCVVPQLGGHVDLRRASDGLAAVLFHEPGRLPPGIHFRGCDGGRWRRHGLRRRR
jgi:hypothetical protein